MSIASEGALYMLFSLPYLRFCFKESGVDSRSLIVFVIFYLFYLFTAFSRLFLTIMNLKYCIKTCLLLYLDPHAFGICRLIHIDLYFFFIPTVQLYSHGRQSEQKWTGICFSLVMWFALVFNECIIFSKNCLVIYN